VHPTLATYPANAACAAHKQGRYREMADLIWAKAFDTRQFDQANIDAIATEVGLEPGRYQADIAGPCPLELKADADLGRKLAVSGTPTFFVNGRAITGARPIAEFQRVIDEELAKATALVKQGVKPEKLYEQEIVGKGVAEVPPP
jgi:protein-disulfide isomerase